MAAYPTLVTAPGSDPRPLVSLEVDRAEDGTGRVRSYGADKVRFEINHPYLGTSDLATLKAFYTANRLLTFDYTSPADGVTRYCIFAGAIAYAKQAGGETHAVVMMEEV